MNLNFPLIIHNSLTGETEEFSPSDEKNIQVYCCGPTLYGDLHVGNWRTFLLADLLVDMLRIKYGDDSVTYVRNITDIDDKIIEKANNQGITCTEVVNRAELKIKEINSPTPHPMTHQPKVTDHIEDIIDMISNLLKKGHGYESGGHVFFDVTTDPKYHLLSKRCISTQISGARIPQNPLKRNYQDFVLWKPVNENESLIPSWDSPWGVGRPGWHIGCSAMIKKHCGEQLDIHIGGQDLIFPHHTNEMSQSRCAHGKELSRFWIHIAPVTYRGKKLSRSSGATLSLDDIFTNRILRRSYKKPLDASLLHIPLGKVELGILPTANSDLQSLSEADRIHCLEPLYKNLNVELFAQRLDTFATSQ